MIGEQIGRLPKKMREVFFPSRRENFSHREIAEILGITEDAGSKQVIRTLRLLRRELSLVAFHYLVFGLIHHN